MCYGLPELSPESVLVSIRTDPFLSANIKLTDAETVMNLIVSLVKGLPFARLKYKKRNKQHGSRSGYLMMAIALSEIWDYKVNEIEIPLDNVHTIQNNNKTVTANPKRATGHREKRGIESIINEGKENSENVNVFGLTGKD